MFTNNLTFLQLCLIIQPHVKELFLVGGCVRDMLLHKTPKDFDIVVNGDLDVIEEQLRENGWKINLAGKQFLVLIASKNNQCFEIAMYRKDGSYTDGRKPDFVSIGTIEEDALRRDFTINSLYLDPWTFKVVDPTQNGLIDLKNKVIRFNGKSSTRILEDKLRIIRCYRFAQKLGFKIEAKTLKNCRRYFGDMVKTVSAERIRLEIEKMAGTNCE